MDGLCPSPTFRFPLGSGHSRPGLEALVNLPGGQTPSIPSGESQAQTSACEHGSGPRADAVQGEPCENHCLKTRKTTGPCPYLGPPGLASSHPLQLRLGITDRASKQARGSGLRSRSPGAGPDALGLISLPRQVCARPAAPGGTAGEKSRS